MHFLQVAADTVRLQLLEECFVIFLACLVNQVLLEMLILDVFIPCFFHQLTDISAVAQLLLFGRLSHVSNHLLLFHDIIRILV